MQGRVEIKPEVVEQDSEYQVKICKISLFANIEETQDTYTRMSSMKPKFFFNSNLMTPDFPHNVRIRLAQLNFLFVVP